MDRLIESADQATLEKIVPIIEIGLHHEQQHQELMLTDILHAFAQNPTHPAYDAAWQPPAFERGDDYARIPSGIRSIGFDGDGFCFDNEQPAHQVLLQEAVIARHLVTNRRVAGVHGRRRLRARTICGCRTAGPRSRPRAGTRRAIGATSTAPGSR